MITQSELACLAGLLEGEGHFTYSKGTQVVQVEMTDEDVVMKVSSLFTKITNSNFHIGSRNRGGNRNTVFWLHATGSNARMIMQMLVKYMHYRRRAQIWRALNKCGAHTRLNGRNEILRLVNENLRNRHSQSI